MFFLLFGFWVLLNGSWTLEIALIGLVVSAALYAFIVKFMGYSPKKEWAIVRRLPRIIGYFLCLVKEVFLSAWATIKLVWSPRRPAGPRRNRSAERHGQVRARAVLLQARAR